MRARLLLLALTASPLAARALPQVRSMLELREEGVVRQGWDLSCGAAALSTVLTQLGDPVGEAEIVEALLRGADAARIRARGGFSLLDLKRYATARGHLAEGFGNLRLANLAALGTAIVPTLEPAGPHFMVYRGVVEGRVVLADPAYGSRTVPVARFERMWSPRVAFVVRPRSGPAPAPGPGARPLAPQAAAVPLVPPRVVREAVTRSSR